MMQHKYEIILYWSKEDEAVIAEVRELTGCMADGANYQEALINVETVIEQWIQGNVVKNGWWFLIRKALYSVRRSEEETGSAGVQLVSNTVYVTKARPGGFTSGFFIGCVTNG